jgi:hypothetical protein
MNIDKYFGWRLALPVLLIPVLGSADFSVEEHLPDPLQAGWEGSPVCEKLLDDARQRILRCSFAPGVGHERHFHAPHFGYTIVGGRMQITDSDGIREIDVPTGSSFRSDGVDWHEVLNVGETTSVFLIVEAKPF